MSFVILVWHTQTHSSPLNTFTCYLRITEMCCASIVCRNSLKSQQQFGNGLHSHLATGPWLRCDDYCYFMTIRLHLFGFVWFAPGIQIRLYVLASSFIAMRPRVITSGVWGVKYEYILHFESRSMARGECYLCFVGFWRLHSVKIIVACVCTVIAINCFCDANRVQQKDKHVSTGGTQYPIRTSSLVPLLYRILSHHPNPVSVSICVYLTLRIANRTDWGLSEFVAAVVATAAAADANPS